MKGLLDTSILVAALCPDEMHHAECLALLREGGHVVYIHSLLETFSTLTGGRRRMRVDAELVARLLDETVRPRVTVVELSNAEIFAVLHTARNHGIRGGAVYDFMHLVAARKAGAECIYTLNLADFEGIRREGDPEVHSPHSLKS